MWKFKNKFGCEIKGVSCKQPIYDYGNLNFLLKPKEECRGK